MQKPTKACIFSHSNHIAFDPTMITKHDIRIEKTQITWQELWQDVQTQATEFVDLSKGSWTELDFPDYVLPSVKVLGLSYHQSGILKLNIPAQVFPNLEYLFVYQSQVQYFEIEGIFAHLKELNLAGNQLTHIPEDFLDRVPGLEWLVLKGNDIKNIRESVLEEENCLESLRATLESFRKGTQKNTEIKLILMGNSTVGKTTLAKLLAGEDIEQTEDSTHGILVSKIKIPDTEIIAYCWDFGGQEYYHATHRLFLNDNAVYCVLWYTATNQQGFFGGFIHKNQKKIPVTLEHYPYDYWLDNIRHYAPQSPILLVQSRKESRQLPDNKVLEKYKIPAEDVHHICVHTHLKEPAVNANSEWKRYYDNFYERLKHIAQETAEKSFTLGKYWVMICDKIREYAEKGEYRWTYADYKQVCREIDPSLEDAELHELSKYLIEIGVILYYPQNKALADVVFVSPTWVTDRIYEILDDKVQKANGKFDLPHIRQSLIAHEVCEAEEVENLSQEILALMAKDGLSLFFPPKTSLMNIMPSSICPISI
ncbi:MAG: COR domain-containing protein [Microscillaceae bacterium]|nr:COR domain-containing protein [Microscillaceae bacterium]